MPLEGPGHLPTISWPIFVENQERGEQVEPPQIELLISIEVPRLEERPSFMRTIGRVTTCGLSALLSIGFINKGFSILQYPIPRYSCFYCIGYFGAKIGIRSLGTSQEKEALSKGLRLIGVISGVANSILLAVSCLRGNRDAAQVALETLFLSGGALVGRVE